MSNEKEFVDGLIVKAPPPNAPDFVKCKISIKVADLGNWLRQKHKNGDEWVNLDVKVSSGGKWYSEVDTWKPKSDAPAQADMDDDVPF